MILTKYAVFNPAIAQYIYLETKEECFSKIVELAISFYVKHSHNSYFKEVYVDEHGYEYLTSTGDNGTEIPQEYLINASNSINI